MGSKQQVADVTIRIDRSYKDRLDQVVRALEGAGLAAVERHDRFMMVNGSIERARLDALRATPGVASVREDAVYKAQ